MSAPRVAIVLAGTTATGKSALGEALAAAIGGEVVCADARQVFRDLDVGTGKPSAEERAAQPHHLFDALAVGESPSAGWYARTAGACCEALFARGVTPILVGGSGLYLRALMRGLHALPEVGPEVRERVRAGFKALGKVPMYARLCEVDPATAERLAQGDTHRIARALEVFESSGTPLSEWLARPRQGGLDARFLCFEVAVPFGLHSARIEERTRWMFKNGLLEETAALLAAGRGEALAALHAIGYDEAAEVLARRLTRATAEKRTDERTRQLAKRQRTWFRHQFRGTPIAGEAPLAAQLAAVRAAIDTPGGGA